MVAEFTLASPGVWFNLSVRTYLRGLVIGEVRWEKGLTIPPKKSQVITTCPVIRQVGNLWPVRVDVCSSG